MDNFAIFFIIFFVIEMVVIFFISKQLIQAIGRLFYRLTGSQTKTVSFLALLFLPGTFIHELAHAIIAGALMVYVGEVEFFPKITDQGVKLGSAQIGQTDIFRRAIIGVAPVLVGLVILIGVVWFAALNTSSVWIWLLILYIIFVVSNTMFSSKKDMEGFAAAFILVVCTILALLITNIINPVNFLTYIFTTSTEAFFKKIDLFLSISIIFDLLILAITKLLRF